MNVSVIAGFPCSRARPKKSRTAPSYAPPDGKSRRRRPPLSLQIAQRAWGMKERFKRSRDDEPVGGRRRACRARSAATGAASRSSWPTSPTIPAAARRGNTTYLLRALKGAGAQQRALRRVQRRGGSRPGARAGRRRDLHRLVQHPGARTNSPCRSTARPRSSSCRDGQLCRPPRRADATSPSDMGPSALLDLGGIQLVVISAPLPLHGPAPVRELRPRHRRGPGRGGKQPRPFPRRVR